MTMVDMYGSAVIMERSRKAEMMDITERLQLALETLEEANVPSDLRPVAFKCIFNALESGATARTVRDASSPSRDNELQRVSDKFKVSLAHVEHAFVFEGEEVELIVPSSRLDPAKSRASEQIALLIAGARQASGLDSDGWTSVEHIRRCCEHFRRHDANNFAATLRDMDDVFQIRGTGRDRKVRMSAPGWQRAGDLLSELVVI
jgi:hypothetical protein